MAKLLGWIALMSTIWVINVTAQTISRDDSTQTLYHDCKGPDKVGLLVCDVYLIGIANMMNVNWESKDALPTNDPGRQMLKSLALCTLNYTGGTLRQVFVEWAEKNPTHWAEAKRVGAWLAIREAWPCQ